MSIAAKCTCGYGPGFCTDRISHCINRINFLNMSKDHTADLDLSEAAKLVPEEIYEWICTKAKERFQSGREGYGFKMGAIAMYHHDQEQIQNLELQINELNKEVEYWISTGKYLNQIGTEEIKTLQSQIIDYRKVLQNFVDKVDRGEARSIQSYGEMKAVLEKYPSGTLPKQTEDNEGFLDVPPGRTIRIFPPTDFTDTDLYNAYKTIRLYAEENLLLEQLLKAEKERSKMYSDWYQDAVETIIGKSNNDYENV
jgi:hypothetical protein